MLRRYNSKKFKILLNLKIKSVKSYFSAAWI